MTKAWGKFLFCGVLALLCLEGGHAAPTVRKAKAPVTLLGAWHCWGVSGISQLFFESQTCLILNGDPMTYRLIPGGIRVTADGRTEDYRYTMKGDALSVTFPNGSCLQCRRMSGGAAIAGMPNGKGGDWQLWGMFCNGGDSTLDSGYDHTSRISFDGKGLFRYIPESSFTSGSGTNTGRMAGRYRVAGNRIYLTFGDGSTGIAHVLTRHSSGRITEVNYSGRLYAVGLCE